MSKNDVIIEGRCQEKLGYPVRLKTDNSVLGEDAARRFPLAVSYTTWTALRVSVLAKEIKPLGKTYEQWANEACILVAETPRKTPANDTELFIRQVFETLVKESAAQEQLLRLEKGSRVKTTLHQEGGWLCGYGQGLVWTKETLKQAKIDLRNVIQFKTACCLSEKKKRPISPSIAMLRPRTGKF